MQFPEGLKKIAPVAGFNWRDAGAGGEASMAWYREAVGLMVERQRELTDAAHATENADNTVRSSLAGARDGLRVTFVSAVTSGGEQGKSDSDALATHPASMTPEQLQRIMEAGHLTSEQATALERGETATISASQMEYLNQLGRSPDGKSPQEIEDLLSKLPPEAQASSALLDVGQKYLDAQVAHEQNPENKFEYFTVDGRGTQDVAITEQIFAAVGDDKIAVDAAVNNPESGGGFVKDVLSHNWTDGGKAASTLFDFPTGDATVENPNDPTGAATATRTGSIMSAVGAAVSTDEAWKLLSNIPEADGQSAGQLNPDLLQTVSRSMSPYILDLAGANLEYLPGFDTAGWIDPDGMRHFQGSTNVFALMNTDETAGTDFTQAAYQEMLAKQGAYALDPMHPSSTNNLDTAGRVAALTDRGLQLGIQDGYDDQARQAAEIYARKNNAYGAMMSLGTLGIGNLPGGDLMNAMIGAGGDPFKESIIGAQPSGAEVATIGGFDSVRQSYNILNAADLPADFVDTYRWAFDEDGNLRPWYELQSGALGMNEISGDFLTMFSMFGNPRDGHDDRMQDAYDAVVWNAH